VQFIEFVCLECLESNPGVAQRPSDVGMARRPFRRAHLLRHRRGQFICARLETGDDPLQQGNPFFSRCTRKTREGFTGGENRAIDVLLLAKTNATRNFFCRRVDHVERTASTRLNPPAVNVKLEMVSHESAPHWGN